MLADETKDDADFIAEFDDDGHYVDTEDKEEIRSWHERLKERVKNLLGALTKQ